MVSGRIERYMSLETPLCGDRLELVMSSSPSVGNSDSLLPTCPKPFGNGSSVMHCGAYLQPGRLESLHFEVPGDNFLKKETNEC